MEEAEAAERPTKSWDWCAGTTCNVKDKYLGAYGTRPGAGALPGVLDPTFPTFPSFPWIQFRLPFNSPRTASELEQVDRREGRENAGELEGEHRRRLLWRLRQPFDREVRDGGSWAAISSCQMCAAAPSSASWVTPNLARWRSTVPSAASDIATGSHALGCLSNLGNVMRPSRRWDA